MKHFRKYHLLKIFEQSEGLPIPLDALLRNYFRQHKAIGAKDRQEICDTLYGMVRWRGLLDHLSLRLKNWEKRLEIYEQINPFDFQKKESIPPHIRVSFPQFVFKLLAESYGEEKAFELCLNSNQVAPTTIRINPLKTTRKDLLDKWSQIYAVSPCKQSPFGIVFHKRENFFALPEFKEGLFEVQDEGSQLVANEVDAKPGDHILDYCAGSGGKTLAFAHKMEGKGQIYLYDIRPSMLKQAKKRLKRSGIENGHPLSHAHLKRKGLLGKMNAILLDVPCSGSGTLRRNPDMKWKITREMLESLILKQRQIFSEVLKFLQPKGRIVYATCSIFPEENEKQISFFMKKYNLKLVKSPFLSFPQEGQMDGFFSATLESN